MLLFVFALCAYMMCISCHYRHHVAKKRVMGAVMFFLVVCELMWYTHGV